MKEVKHFRGKIEQKSVVDAEGELRRPAIRPLNVYADTLSEALDKLIVAWTNDQRSEEDIEKIELKYIGPYQLG